MTTLAHEMIHCFQAAFSPNETVWRTAPGWVIEGSAEWASSTLVGPDKLEGDLWPRYLDSPGTPLFKRTYDAIGFYAHLEETGHSPWATFREVWGTTGNAAQFAAAGGTSADFLDSDRHQRRRDHFARHPHRPEQPGQLIAGRAGLVTDPQPRRRA